MSDNGLGCVWIGAIMTMVILLAALTFGAPLINSAGLSWDNSAAIIRSNNQVAINADNNATKRHESDNWHATAQQVAIVAGVVGVVSALAWATQRSVTAWAARPHRPVAEHRQLAAPPSHIVIVAKPWLSAMRDSDLEHTPRGWAVVSRAQGKIHYLEDKRQ